MATFGRRFIKNGISSENPENYISPWLKICQLKHIFLVFSRKLTSGRSHWYDKLALDIFGQ